MQSFCQVFLSMPECVSNKIDSEFAKISDSGRIESIINEPADEAADIIEKKISI